MDNLYINFSGLTIKISFGKVSRAVLIAVRAQLKKDIKTTYKGFIVDKPKNIDFYIKFVEKGKEFNVLMLNQKNKMCYVRIYEEVSKNKIEVYYSLSLSQLQFILNYILSEYVYLKNGFMIHSSAVATKSGSSYLFLGVPGAGKSTAAHLLKNHYKFLADDSGVVEKKGNSYLFYQTPFIEKVEGVSKSNSAYPINKIFILKKANYFKIEKITEKSILLDKLIRFNEAHQILNFTLKYKTNKNYIKVLLEFISNFDEFYYLYFAKDSKKLLELMSNTR